MRKRNLLLAGLGTALGLAAHGQPAKRPDPAAYNGFDLAGSLVPVAAIERGGPPRDGIPALDRPRYEAAAASQLRPADRVLGLVHRGVARACPCAF